MPTTSQIFENMPERFDPATAGDMDATVQFSLTGDNGGEWYVTVADGDLAVEEGTADNPKSTIIMDADDFVAMSTGELNAMSAFMSGKVKVEGDLNTVMKLQPALGL
jgi:putative sterol carrier protein